LALLSKQLEPNLEPIEEELLNKHFERKHGACAYYGQGADR
jgi:L-ribulose-5-phosphate 4-epimerase